MKDLETYYEQLRKAAQKVTSILSNKKKKKPMSRKNKNTKLNGSGPTLKLKSIVALTENQDRTFEAFYNGKNLLLHGFAGTGKTFLSLYLSLRELYQHDTPYHRLLIVRSAVPARDLGFMPGSLEEKVELYEAPYKSICYEITGNPKAYEELKRLGLIEFVSTSYIRGTTLNDCIVIVDEIQNCDFGELSTIVTRLGRNCKIIFCGDFRQSDFRNHEFTSKKDVHNFMSIIKRMKNDFEVIEFGINDIVRHPLVKNFIILTEQMGL